MISEDIDKFATLLLEEAKRFAEKASESQCAEDAKTAYLHAALTLAFCALEAHVNSVADDFAGRPELSRHEASVLLEKEVALEGGKFVLKSGLKIHRLDDRIEFLHQRFGGAVENSSGWKGMLKSALKLRNALTHPKKVPVIDDKEVATAIQAVITTIDTLYRTVYKKPLPSAVRGLQSKLTF